MSAAAASRCILSALHGCRTEHWTQSTGPVALSGDLSESQCRQHAHHRWLMCENAGVEPFEYVWLSDDNVEHRGSYPAAEVREALLRLKEWTPLSIAFHYDVAFFWANREFTQYSDTDVSEPDCGREWDEVRWRVWAIAQESLSAAPFPLASTSSSTSSASPLRIETKTCKMCLEFLPLSWMLASKIDNAEFPFSGAFNDCFLGVLSLLATEVLCGQLCAELSLDGGEALETVGALWKRLQQELEVLFFFVNLRLDELAMANWPIVQLLQRIGALFRELFGEVLPNECDLLDDPFATAFRNRLHTLAKGNDRRPEVAREVVDDSLNHIQSAKNACPFGHASALLGLERVPTLWSHIRLDRTTDYYFDALDSLKVWDAVHGHRVGKERHFFYDLISTRWPWLGLLEANALATGATLPKPSQEAFPSSCPAHIAVDQDTWLWHRTSPFNAHGTSPLADQLSAGDASLHNALCLLDNTEVLFMSGTSSGYMWGSFTVRGRQAARGLRKLWSRGGPRMRARAWNQNCEVWCKQYRALGPQWSSPTVIIHIKYPCNCAMELLAEKGALHVYDPVDQFALVPPGMHGLLAQTSLAARDYAEHPGPKAAGLRVYFHPLHHSNFRDYRIPQRTEKLTVGSHTTHNDTELYDAIQDMLASKHPDASWLHIDPSQRFSEEGTHVVSPQQTARVLEQFGELDVAVMRHAGCMMHLKCETTRKWFCDRYKTGQRLVNAFAAGLPTVLWREQGFLDVVAGSSYPAIAGSIHEALHWISRLVSDNQLRDELRLEGLRLAQPFALSRQSERLAMILADLLLARRT
eukprot:TRINITY_DN50441_c0_g1_i2.p1 TRINITY_DN50441_c0_g1~~TRINITY_DN50441_c0_g1_i2.p1  ORF type:complete len:810 (-),score=100.86 TRINITY_DN50441_c0_g1_i2:218-2647(-)